MSAAAVQAIRDTIDLGQRLARLAKDDDALDLTQEQAADLIRAVDVIAGSLARVVDATYVVTTSSVGRQQRSLGADNLARYLRGVSNEAQRHRGVRDH